MWAGEVDVHDRRVGRLLPDQLERRHFVGGGAKDIVPGAFENAGEPKGLKGLVLNDEDTQDILVVHDQPAAAKRSAKPAISSGRQGLLKRGASANRSSMCASDAA